MSQNTMQNLPVLRRKDLIFLNLGLEKGFRNKSSSLRFLNNLVKFG
jgi:hypothetical protein